METANFSHIYMAYGMEEREEQEAQVSQCIRWP
jgi:hypothetical protein